MFEEILSAPSYIFYIEHFLNPLFLYILFQNLYFPIAVSAIWEIVEYFLLETVGHYSILFLEVEPSGSEPLWDILVLDIGAAVFASVLGYFLVRSSSVRIPTTSWFSSKFWWYIFRAILTAPISAIGWECATLLSFLCVDNANVLPWGAFGIIVIDGLFAWFTWENWYVVMCVVLISSTAFFGKLISGPLLAFGVCFALILYFVVVWLCRRSEYDLVVNKV